MVIVGGVAEEGGAEVEDTTNLITANPMYHDIVQCHACFICKLEIYT